MRTVFAAICAIGWAIGAAQAQCPNNPSALGTARIIAVDPAEHGRVGSLQYPETLPLKDHEVVLTFDDGPIPRYTNRVLDILAAECVKATFFSVGMMAQHAPGVLRRAVAEGHTIGTHTQTHPLRMARLPIDRARSEIDAGIASVRAALGDSGAVAPFLRIPGLGRTAEIEAYAASAGLMVWSGDAGADDWKRISPAEVTARALAGIERKGRGIIILHDIHERTVVALPGLLAELKRRGFHIVHVVPAGPDRPKTPTTAEEWSAHSKVAGNAPSTRPPHAPNRRPAHSRVAGSKWSVGDHCNLWRHCASSRIHRRRSGCSIFQPWGGQCREARRRSYYDRQWW